MLNCELQDQGIPTLLLTVIIKIKFPTPSIEFGFLFVQIPFEFVEDLLELFFSQVANAGYLFCLPGVKDVQEVVHNTIRDGDPPIKGDKFPRFN